MALGLVPRKLLGVDGTWSPGSRSPKGFPDLVHVGETPMQALPRKLRFGNETFTSWIVDASQAHG